MTEKVKKLSRPRGAVAIYNKDGVFVGWQLPTQKVKKTAPRGGRVRIRLRTGRD